MNGLPFSIAVAVLWWVAPIVDVAGAWEEDTAFLHEAKAGHPASSRSQRFVLRGFDTRDGIMLGRWVEKTAGSLETWIGYSVPFKRMEMVRINAEGETGEAPGTLLMGQGYADSRLQQQLVVAGPEAVTEEAFLEGFVQVLLNRYVLYADTKRPPAVDDISVPDWLTVGIAQNLNPRLRDRNRSFARDRWRGEAPPPLAEIASWQTLPPRRTGEKAVCGLFMEWWQERRGEEGDWSRVLRALAAGDRLTPDWVAGFLGDGDRAEAAWRAWTDAVAVGEFEWGELDMDRVAAFKRRLAIDVRDFGLQPIKGIGPHVTARDLLDRRHESWVSVVAMAIAGEMQRVVAGSPPHLADVAQNYGQYFRAFVPGPKERAMSQKALGLLLEKAGEGLVQLEKDVTLRHHVLDKAAREAVEGVELSPAVSDEDLADMRRRFLDSVQERASAP